MSVRFILIDMRSDYQYAPYFLLESLAWSDDRFLNGFAQSEIQMNQATSHSNTDSRDFYAMDALIVSYVRGDFLRALAMQFVALSAYARGMNKCCRRLTGLGHLYPVVKSSEAAINLAAENPCFTRIRHRASTL